MLRELKTLIAVVEHGTFSAAAARIGLTQSAVSSQIQRLEEELGVKLFDRSGRTPCLTKAGEEAHALAGEMLGVYARLLKQPSIAENTGTLRIGAIASVQESVLAQPVAAFREAFPAWRVQIVTGGGLMLLGQLDEADIDLAVVSRPSFTLPDNFEWRRLAFEPFVLLVPESMAGQPWQTVVERMPFIRLARNSFGGQLVDRFLSRERIVVQDAIEIVDLHGIASMVASGAGVALVPKTIGLRAWPTGLTALDLGAQTFYREIGIIMNPRHSRHLAIQRFVDEIIRLWGDEPAMPTR